MDNDSVAIDLPLFLPYGTAGPSLNFDFTRHSAYNRDVSQARLQARVKFTPRQRMAFTYRLKGIDRKYLEIKQGGETETVSHELKARWDGRFKKVKASLWSVYTDTDHAFANRAGIFEEPLCNATPIAPSRARASSSPSLMT